MAAHPCSADDIPSVHEVPSSRASSWRRTTSGALLALSAVVFTAAVVLLHAQVSSQVALEAVGAVGPGTHLQLQTAAGPMALTVDSQMNSAGYVHAYGFKNGQEYAGYVKLTAANPAAAAVLQNAPSSAEQQLAQYPLSNPYTQQAVYAQAAQGYAQPGVQQPLQLHISPDGSVSLNGEQVSAADSKTAAVLRLLSKQAALRSPNGGMSLSQQISNARQSLKQLEEEDQQRRGRASMLSQLPVHGREHRGREHAREHEPRKAMWAAMQTIMHNVDRIEHKEDKMEKTVDKVKKIMRYSPFH
mmetsp:Transcript_63126/g.131251  ORF Transcript_63126/g.131251 Transcript_63126/m.131251 type:complete len:301 (+) Transcript_63126:21-923(+)